MSIQERNHTNVTPAEDGLPLDLLWRYTNVSIQAKSHTAVISVEYNTHIVSNHHVLT